ncbi:hypothetical protein TSO221_25645 [Azospirillum sp. TSO22-1]|nr:hypothetical protein TSO221_25645 [Azospirillum sp. TSO22-1]
MIKQAIDRIASSDELAVKPDFKFTLSQLFSHAPNENLIAVVVNQEYVGRLGLMKIRFHVRLPDDDIRIMWLIKIKYYTKWDPMQDAPLEASPN